MTNDTTFRISPLDADTLDRVRTSGIDASGHPAEHLTAAGGEPLRCCLRDAGPGESLLLFGYQPALPPSPYREVGAVFAHEAACPGATSTAYPAAWRGRPQVLRAYDARGWIHPATCCHDGNDPEAVIAKILADPEVVVVHSRNVSYGCLMFAITRV